MEHVSAHQARHGASAPRAPTPADKAAPVLIAAAALTTTVYLSLAAWVLWAGA